MDILIEESEGQLWAAAMDGQRLCGLEVDPVDEAVRWGSLYYAKIKTLDPARDAAYLDLDGSQVGLIFNKDLRGLDHDKSVAISKRLTPGQMILVQAKTAYITKPDDAMLSAGSKVPEMSMDITLQGRYLIYAPFMEGNRLSQRIADPKLRKTIESMLAGMEDIDGCILRVSAANTQTDIVHREALILQQSWRMLMAEGRADNPHMLMAGPDAVQRILSDNAVAHIGHVDVVTMDHFQLVESWMSVFAPDLVAKITPVELPDAEFDLALFHERDVMQRIEALFQPYCMLPGGGNIIIQGTAALTAIDVNKGSDSGAHMATNLEAVVEALRQIRLRNIGGVIMVDCIGSMKAADQKAILKAVRGQAMRDPCTVQIHGFTGTGMLELTRKRRTPPLIDRVDLGRLS